MRADAGSSAAAGSIQVTKSAVALGTQLPSQSAFTYYEITGVCKRGLSSLLTITPDGPGKWDLDVRNAAAGGGKQYLAAVDADGTYNITIPVYLEGDANSSIWIGIKNKDVASHVFTLTALRVEKFS